MKQPGTSTAQPDPNRHFEDTMIAIEIGSTAKSTRRLPQRQKWAPEHPGAWSTTGLISFVTSLLDVRLNPDCLMINAIQVGEQLLIREKKKGETATEIYTIAQELRRKAKSN